MPSLQFKTMILNLFDRMKLPFRKNKEFLSALYDILGFYPHNLDIYRIAFSHKSLSYHRDNDAKVSGKDRKGGAKERRKPRTENTSKPLNNERLEYLGDAVLESVVSDILFRHFPNKREGFLTSTRSKIVQREALNRLAADMGLEKLILAAQGTRMAHTNIGGNAFEALMGAIYLDRGYKHCHWFISNRVVGRYVDLENVAQKEVNFKSKLLEWSQKNRINISFKDSADDNKGFKTIIVMEGITLARGNGRSKKESQQEASKEALTRMRREPKTYDNIFRAKEKRTAMEAEESFALPKIDEIENSISKGKKTKAAKNEADAPVLEDKKQAPQSASDAAYDTAYDETATFEVIDTPPEEPQLSADYYEEKGLPAPPEEDELRAADEKLRKKRARNRGAKTVGDAVKGVKKGVSTPEEKAERREAERLAEVERQRAKAERKRKQIEAQQAADKTAAKTQKTAETSIEETIVATEDIPEIGMELAAAAEVAKPIVEEAVVTETAPERVVEETIAVEEEPERVIEETIAVEEGPEQVTEETIAAEEEPKQIIEETIATEEEPEQVTEETITTEEEPEQVIKETIATEEEPEQVIEETIAVEEEPEQVIEETIAVEEEPEQAIKETITAEEEPEEVIEEATTSEEKLEKVVENLSPLAALVESLGEHAAETKETTNNIPTEVATDFIIKEDIPTIDEIPNKKEDVQTEAVDEVVDAAVDTAVDTAAEEEKVSIEAEDIKPTAAKETTTDTTNEVATETKVVSTLPPISFDAIVFGSDNDDHMGYMHDDAASLDTDDDLLAENSESISDASEASQAQQKGNGNVPSNKKKHRRRRPAHDNAQADKEGKGNKGNKSPKPNEQTSQHNTKASKGNAKSAKPQSHAPKQNIATKEGEHAPQGDAKQQNPNKKRNNHRRRPYKGKNNNNNPEAPVA